MKNEGIVPTPANSGERYYYLDAARAIALFLGIIFHGVMFMVSYISPMVWAIKNQQSNVGVDTFFFISHTFRMQTFFLVAGFFAHMVYHKYNTRGFIMHRFQRITKPLLIFWPFIYLVICMLWIWGYQSMGYLNANPDLPKYSFMQIFIGNFTSGNWLNNGFPLTHLWFLYMLTWFFIFVVVIRFLFERAIDKTLNIRAGIDRCIVFMMTRWWGSLAFALFTIPAMWYMQSTFGVDTSDQGLLPKIPPFIVFGFYFSLGWFLHRNQQLLEKFKKYWKSNLILSLIFLITVSLLFLLQFNQTLIQRYMANPFFLIVFKSIYGLASMTTVFAFIGIMMVWFARQNKWVRYLSDASYWLYLIHLPVVVFFQVLVSPLSLHWAFKLCLIFIPSLLILFTSYHFLVRKTQIGWMLNGKKY